ncbi:MAG: hypothetical protein EP338_09025 [Bacteroidetes bacterium]|nr:MAG: hypothetical protein EP338_09025 [Bacteroidota bacterium]
MRKLVQAIYNMENGEVLIQHPEERDVWVSVDHFNTIIAEVGTREKTSCRYTEEEVCTGVTIGPPPDYKQTKFGCKKVKTCECERL